MESAGETQAATLMNRHAVVIAVYGLINAGKSSLINAFTGVKSQETSPVGGTTRNVEPVPWTEFDTTLDEFELTLLDTPGLEEIGGDSPALVATEAAKLSDVVLFIAAEDLTESAIAAIHALREAAKPILVALNKIDLLEPESLDHVLQAIRERLAGIIDPSLVIPIAAAPLVRERVIENGVTRLISKHGQPEIEPLLDALRTIIRESGKDLTALNTLRQEIDAHAAAREVDKAARRERAERVADETSVALAMALAVNPVPLIAYFTAPGGLAILVRRVSAVYDERPTLESARALARELIRGGRPALWGSMAALVGGSAIKILPGIGHVIGSLTQGAATGYLAHILGRGLVDYLENGHNWGDAGIEATLAAIAQRTDRKAITRGISDELRRRLKPEKNRK